MFNFILEVLLDHTGRMQTANPGEGWLVVRDSQGNFFPAHPELFSSDSFQYTGLFLLAPCTETFTWYTKSAPLYTPGPVPSGTHSELLSLPKISVYSLRRMSPRNPAFLFLASGESVFPFQSSKALKQMVFIFLIQLFTRFIQQCCLFSVCPAEIKVLNCFLKWILKDLFINNITLGFVKLYI